MLLALRIGAVAGLASLLTGAVTTGALADTYSTQSVTQYSTQNGYSTHTTVQTPQGTQTFDNSIPANQLNTGMSFPSILPPVNVTVPPPVPPLDIFGNGAASSQSVSSISNELSVPSSDSSSSSSVTPESSSSTSSISSSPIPFLNSGFPFATLEQEIQSLEQRVAQLEAEVAALQLEIGSHSSSSSSASTTYHVTLSADQQVPPVSSSGSGIGTFTLSGSNLSYHISVESLTSPIVAAHFHLGAAGQNGAVLQPIAFSGSWADGVWNGLSQDQINDLNTGMIYVNVHTSNYPDGEIRGQILP